MKITILQIGAGGTGSWFARLLAHGIASRLAKAPEGEVHPFARGFSVSWVILDPDTVEIKNQARQLFLGAEAIGAPKSDYLARMILMILGAADTLPDKVDASFGFRCTPRTSLVQSVDTLKIEEDFTQASSDDRTIIVSCVDNTFTRSVLESGLIELRGESPRNAHNNVLWLDMGVTADDGWAVFGALWRDVVKTKFESLTYPDAMMSCAERQERGPVPQTTFANCCAGAHASRVALEFICSPENFYGAFVIGKGHESRNAATTREEFLKLCEDIQK